MSIFNTSFDYNGKSRVDQFADFALWPVRYAFGGRDVVEVIRLPRGTESQGGREFTQTEARANGNWLKTVLAIITFIPGLIFGVIAKCIAYLSSPKFLHCFDAYNPNEAQAPNHEIRDICIVHRPIEDWLCPSFQKHLTKRFPQATFHMCEYTHGSEILGGERIFLLRGGNDAGKCFTADGVFAYEDFEKHTEITTVVRMPENDCWAPREMPRRGDDSYLTRFDLEHYSYR